MATDDVDRADDDVRGVKALAATLRRGSPDERAAWRAVLERARGGLASSPE